MDAGLNREPRCVCFLLIYVFQEESNMVRFAFAEDSYAWRHCFDYFVIGSVKPSECQGAQNYSSQA